MCVEVEAPELVGVADRPGAWPSFRAYGCELRCALDKLQKRELKYFDG